MGYSVYWANGRWQGYGVDAICDYKGCYEEINRGLGYMHTVEDEEGVAPSIFCCEKHRYEDYEECEIDLKKESKKWLSHILSHDSWAVWRGDNERLVDELKEQVEENTQ